MREFCSNHSRLMSLLWNSASIPQLNTLELEQWTEF
jgi:hypothetical protein